jgi:hypothetical protein
MGHHLFMSDCVGDVVLQNLELQDDALSELNLPIDVEKGMNKFVIFFISFLSTCTYNVNIIPFQSIIL